MKSLSLGGLETARSIKELEQAAAAIEPVFLDAGERLGQAVDRLHAVSSSFSLLAAQYDGGDMQECADNLHKVLSVASSLGSAAVHATSGQLERLSASLHAMSGRLARLGKTVGEVKLVALNAKVESAHLDTGKVDFSVFTREIDRLAADAAAELKQMDGALRGLAEQTTTAHRAQTAFSTSHGGELASVCDNLSRSLDLLAGQHRASASAAAQIGERSRKTGDRIGEIISSLQIGDITRQRTEHIAQALGLLPELPTLAPTLSAAELSHAAGLVASLQAGQLQQAAADLDTEAGRVAAHLGALASEAHDLSRLGHASFSSAEGNSLLDGLAAEMARTRTLMERYGEALSHTRTAMRAVSAAAEVMRTHVEAIHSIEADLKIMALNASFKCSRLGDKGRTLSVVAQSLRQLANRTVEDAAHLMEGLHAAAAIAETLSHDQTEIGDIDGALANLQAVAAVLAANGASQDAALRGLDDNSAGAQTLLRNVAGRIAATASFSARLRAVATDLVKDADTADLAPGRAEELRTLVFANLAGNYTMASERALHDLFDGTDSAPAAEAAPVDVDDLLF